MQVNRVIVLVLDSLGIGALPDASKYGDEGSNTLKHIADNVSGFYLPNLHNLGLGNIVNFKGLEALEDPLGYYGKMMEQSPGKDTTTGHWELAGNVLDRPFPVYPEGFPSELIEQFENQIGKKTLGNYPASGTAIIKELGKEHEDTGYPIVYTSADSVFQIAAHEEIIPPQKLYDICEIARELLTGEHGVGRVIARPFVGKFPDYTRTENRRDFSLAPPEGNMLDLIKEQGYDVVGIGKVKDIYANKGLTETYPTKSNADGIDKTTELLNENNQGLIMTNLVDFDMLYGHRNDPEGYYKALFEFDNSLPNILASLNDDDILIITADHGCDPLHPGTDHTREYVPILIYNHKLENPTSIGTRSSFADMGQTITDLLNVGATAHGSSFKDQLNFR
ncbi:phosphopentomutase [Natranaerobius thermophilus]|uniref:Phosphopentomutase n=1 Tax=Natranaerobius thermophilus (strain ATCC BAA-1301 / DSM 18059 / JW/NM-WN-LF) TaxID=457570 RepID=B2A4Z9_NATTJ|nr:phosphopentomutase [Natranaerobius thermophilus]ACB85241.1 phosphopentomutase [Natranaerobius thermophilus JW/NM-WN-LF]